MERQRLQALVLAGLGVVAVAIAAAALRAPREARGGESASPFSINVTAETGATSVITIPEPIALLLAIILGAFLVLGVLMDPVSAARELARVIFAAAVVGILFYLIIQLFSQGEGSLLPGFAEADSELGAGSGEGSGVGSGTADRTVGVDLPTWLLFGLFAVGMGALVLATLGLRRSTLAGGGFPEPSSGDDEHELEELGAIAGRTLARLDGTTAADNEVYRAWREMTDRLDVERPHSSTPGEFGRAAVEAGMDPALVDELTDLFETVRYGGTDPTPDLEERARSVLGEIEARYDPVDDLAADPADTLADDTSNDGGSA